MPIGRAPATAGGAHLSVKIRILGSAAGGGFPQWNCNCPNCRGFRAGSLRARMRTQSSIVVSGQDPARWVLVNASPDIRAQLQAYADLQPNRALRDSALCALVLVDGQVDHTTGLYMLRESTRPWPVWCTDSTYADLTQGNPVLKRAVAFLRDRAAPHGARPALRRCRDAGCSLACFAGREQARAVFAEPRRAHSRR